MIFFNSIKVIDSPRFEDLPFEISELKDLNVLVGPNGCGKTTVMGAILDLTHDQWDKTFHTKLSYVRNPAIVNKVDCYSLFYKDLAKIKHDFSMYDDGFLGAYDVMNSFKSAGERSATQIDDIATVENGVILIDEMDASLDWRQQRQYVSKLKALAVKNQVFVATHSPLVCSQVEEMYDVSQRRWCTWNEIKEHYGLEMIA